jgi:hypothetical protein
LASSQGMRGVLAGNGDNVDLASFLTFLGTIDRQDDGTMDDLLLLAYALPTTTALGWKGDTPFLKAWLALYALNPGYMLRKLEVIPTYGAWGNLASLAVLNCTSSSPSSPPSPQNEKENKLHRSIVHLFADQLAADYSILEASLNASDEDGNGKDLMDLSEAARGAPRKGMHADKVCRLAGDIACVLRPVGSASGEDGGNEKYEKDRLTTYVGYSKTCQSLRRALAERDKGGLVLGSTKAAESDRSLGRLSEEERRAILESEPNSFGVSPHFFPLCPRLTHSQ